MNLIARLSVSVLFISLLWSPFATAQLAQAPTSDTTSSILPDNTISYCVDPDWAPYEAIRNGQHIGISADYMRIISDYTGIAFKLVPTESWQESLEFVQAGKCQMISMLNVSDFRKQFLDFSIPYFEAPNILVARKGTPILQGYAGIGNRSVGIVKGYRQVEYITRYYPELRLKLIKSEREGLLQLMQGEFDVMVGSLMSVNTHINNQNIQDVAIVGYAEPFDSLGFGVNKSISDILPIVNQAIAIIPETKRVEIYRQWNDVQVRYQRDYVKLVMTLMFVLLVVIGLVWRNRTVALYKRLMKQKNAEIESLQTTLLDRNRTLEFLSAHDSLTGLYNRNHMIQKAEEEISRFLRFHTRASLIVLELIPTKDRRHEADPQHCEQVLKILASVCLATVREVDVVSRFSGEQFAVLCPQTTLAEGEVLAERLITAVTANSDITEADMTVAVGLSDLKEGEGFPDWFERTHKALYQSKRLGFGKLAIAE